MVSSLRIGFVPGDADQVMASAFVSAVGQALGTTLEPHQAADYRGLAAALEQGLAHMAWVPPVPAARALRTGAVQAAVVVVRNGATSYQTALIAHASSDIASLADLDGARAAWVDRDSASGYLLIRAALRGEGVSLTRAFGSETFVRSHAEVAHALRTGRADVGATFVSFTSGTRDVARAGWRAYGLEDDEVRLLLHAGPIPSDVLLVGRSVSGSHLAALQAAIVDARPALAHQTARDLLHADGFVRATDDHLAMLSDLLARLESPLASWPPLSGPGERGSTRPSDRVSTRPPAIDPGRR